MLMTTVNINTDYRVLGLVQGSCMRARHLGQDIAAEVRKLFGGEVREYAALIAEARKEALDKMVAEAKTLGANGIIGVRFSTSTVTSGAAEIIAYGTAVKI
jgi:uncharacterized protein YbjQ (UPF0145 family)